jgi:hypothetical protein
MRLDISMEELFPVPIERVWHALTESDERTVRGITGGWTDKLGALAELLTTKGGNGND